MISAHRLTHTWFVLAIWAIMGKGEKEWWQKDLSLPSTASGREGERKEGDSQKEENRVWFGPEHHRCLSKAVLTLSDILFSQFVAEGGRGAIVSQG